MRTNHADRLSRRPVNGLIGVLVIPVALVALALGIQAAHAANNAGPGPLPVTSVQHHTLGIPAITPRAALATSGGAHFTGDDVKSYIATHPQMLPAAPGKPAPIVNSVQFLTAGQASALLQGESIGLPDTSLVCLVRVQGTFVNTYTPPGVSNGGTYTTATLVFDAQTGNLLIG